MTPLAGTSVNRRLERPGGYHKLLIHLALCLDSVADAVDQQCVLFRFGFLLNIIRDTGGDGLTSYGFTASPGKQDKWKVRILFPNRL